MAKKSKKSYGVTNGKYTASEAERNDAIDKFIGSFGDEYEEEYEEEYDEK